MTDVRLKYWKTDAGWACAIPRDDDATQRGFHWKEYGHIGHGKTQKLALADWESWKVANDFVASIY